MTDIKYVSSGWNHVTAGWQRTSPDNPPPSSGPAKVAFSCLPNAGAVAAVRLCRHAPRGSRGSLSRALPWPPALGAGPPRAGVAPRREPVGAAARPGRAIPDSLTCSGQGESISGKMRGWLSDLLKRATLRILQPNLTVCTTIRNPPETTPMAALPKLQFFLELLFL